MLPREATGTDTNPIADYLSEVQSRVQRGVCDCPDAAGLLAAVEATLAQHRPVEYAGLRCATCYLLDVGKASWPCDTYKAVAGALLASRA